MTMNKVDYTKSPTRFWLVKKINGHFANKFGTVIVHLVAYFLDHSVRDVVERCYIYK